MQWFNSQGNMLHIENNIYSLVEHLQYFFKLLSMFKIRIWYDETIVAINVPYYVGIMCINWLFVRKSDDRKPHHLICHKYGVPACWFILDHPVKPKLNFYFQYY